MIHTANLELIESPHDRVIALAVSPHERDHASLQSMFRRSNWRLYGVGTLAEALDRMRVQQIPVLLCEHRLPDGDWKDALRALEDLPCPPSLIVTSSLADESLWAEVLNLRGYDVLAKPIDPSELYRIIPLAWWHWKRGCQMRTNGKLLCDAVCA